MSIDDNTDSTEKRIQGLIQERNQARSDLQEARAEIASLTEAGAAGKSATEAAVLAAKAELQSRVTELEGELRRGKNRQLLSDDKISPDQQDDILSYLDFQYSKVEAGDDGAKPEFDAWYREARKTNRVLRAAMKPSVAASAASEIEPEVVAPKVEPRSAPRIPTKPAVVPVQPGSSGREVDLSKVKIGTPEWKAAKERLRVSAFAK